MPTHDSAQQHLPQNVSYATAHTVWSVRLPASSINRQQIHTLTVSLLHHQPYHHVVFCAAQPPPPQNTHTTPPPQLLWSSSLALSCNLLLLVLFEVLNVLDPGCAQQSGPRWLSHHCTVCISSCSPSDWLGVTHFTTVAPLLRQIYIKNQQVIIRHPSVAICTRLLPRLRSWDWHLTVWGLLLLLVGILPWYHSYRTLAGSGAAAAVLCPALSFLLLCRPQSAAE